MNDQWTAALRSHGLSETCESVLATLGSQSADTLQLIDLSGLSVVEVSGTDVAAFLQGQFCNDLTQVTPMHAQITGYCNPKGRLLALPAVVGLESGFRLVLPTDICDAFTKRLKMFVLRANVHLHVRSDLICTGLLADSGGGLGQAAAGLGVRPVGVLDAATSETHQLLRWHDSHIGDMVRQRFISIATIDQQLALWAECTEAIKTNLALWRLADITAGVPSIRTGVVEAFIPQMVNLQLINALSFTKGCYPGQEIVARMQYLGKLKRHMRHFSMSGTDVLPAVGDSLSVQDDNDAGTVIDAVGTVENVVHLLAVVKVSANQAELSFQGKPLLPHDLPYPLPSLDELSVDVR